MTITDDSTCLVTFYFSLESVSLAPCIHRVTVT